MHSAVLEVEKLLNHLKEQANISANNYEEALDEWEQGYAAGAGAAYDDSIEQCEQILSTLTKLYK